MTDGLTASCADLAAWLPIAQALITEPDADGTTGGGQPGTRPPWNPGAANAVMDPHEGVRRLEATMRLEVTGHTGPRRGGSDANTMAAIKAVEALANAVSDTTIARANAHLTTWVRRILELAAVDKSEPWRRIPAECPYCHFQMLRVAPRAGTLTCLRYGACSDNDGRHPIGHVYVSQLTGDPKVHWNDGLVTP